VSLADCCRKSFSQRDVQSGTDYFASGAVEVIGVEGTMLDAAVSGSGTSPYDVVLDWAEAESRLLEVWCSCPRFADVGLCKHVFAVILAADAQGLTPRGVKGRFDVYEMDDGGDFEDYDDDPDAEERSPYPMPTKRGASVAPLKPGAKKKAVSQAQLKHWKKQFAVVTAENARLDPQSTRYDPAARKGAKPRQVWFLFHKRECEGDGALVIRFYHCELKKNGEFSKLKTFNLSRKELALFDDADDREALDLFMGMIPSREYGYYPSYGYSSSREFSQCELSPAMSRILLPKLCARGRLLYSDVDHPPGQWAPDQARPVAWDDGSPWRFRLHFELEEKQKNRLVTGRIHRGDQAADISRPAFVLSSGAMLLDDRLTQVELGAGASWAAALRKEGPLAIPLAQEEEMLEQFYRLPSLPELEMPAELRWDQAALQPRPRITIKKPQQGFRSDELEAVVRFEYEDRVASPGDVSPNIVDRTARRVIHRDLERERVLMAQAHGLGFKNPDYYDRGRCDLRLPAKLLPRVMPALMKAGWQVEAEGKLIRQAGEFKLSVSSGVDWFDLEARCDFGGVTVGLPKLLEALRLGQTFVVLDDGSQGMLPEKWLEKFAPLAGLGETQGDAVRFRPSQAMFLDALLAAQPDAEVDARFAQARAKLREFAGVGSREQPKGFVGRLRDYQQLGLGWLHFLQDFGFGGCLADDMGLGKTIQVLALLEERRTRRAKPGRPRLPSLVVAPKSLVHNWVEEAARFAPKMRVLDYTGLDRGGKLDDLSRVDLVVTTYATLRLDILKFKDLRFDYAILDEAQATKNSDSQTAKTCRLLQADHRLAMTGTPVENHLGELWSIFEFLNPGMLGRSETFKTFSSGGRAASSESLQLLSQTLRPFLLRRTKEQVLTELPAKTEQTLYCDLDGQQRKLYDELRDHYRLALAGQIESRGLKKSKIQVLEALLRLRQAACHPGLLDKKRIDEPSAKLDALLEQVDAVHEEGHKAIVFSQFTSLLDIVRKRLDVAKINYTYLDGKTRDRKKVVEKFQNDEACRLFLISLKAGGLGLNLTAADYVFILDPWWNPAVEAQAVDRAHRLGQTRPVFAYRLIARNTVEEKIIELQSRKRQLADAIVSVDGSLISQLTADELRLLLS